MVAHYHDLKTTPSMTFPGNAQATSPAPSSSAAAPPHYMHDGTTPSPWPGRANPADPTPWKQNGPASQGQQSAREAADALANPSGQPSSLGPARPSGASTARAS
eukprot:7419371-Heterocapsa_arctica.AAC.1